jgi:hypothetical protein
MVGATGFEPATSCSQSKCSSQAELRSDEGRLLFTRSEGCATGKFRGAKNGVHECSDFGAAFPRGFGIDPFGHSLVIRMILERDF